MRIGYARVSTNDQNPMFQVDALAKAKCERIFTERASGVQRNRPELSAGYCQVQSKAWASYSECGVSMDEKCIHPRTRAHS